MRPAQVAGAPLHRVVRGGVDPQGSGGLLDRLLEWATQEQFVYQHEWHVGDLVIWDYTGTTHRVVPYSVESGRVGHRTTLVGEEPLA